MSDKPDFDSLFSEPEKRATYSFLLQGDAGTGKTLFAMGITRSVQPVAIVNPNGGALVYKNKKGVGDFRHITSYDHEEIQKALKALRHPSHPFKAVIVDMLTDVWNLEQLEKINAKGEIPVHQREGLNLRHKEWIKPLHLQAEKGQCWWFFITEEKAIVEKQSDGSFKEVDYKTEGMKKDPHVCDIHLRFFKDVVDGKRIFCAEVIKDRSFHFRPGEVIANPRVEMFFPESTGEVK